MITAPPITRITVKEALPVFRVVSSKEHKGNINDIRRADGSLLLGCIGEIPAGQEIQYHTNDFEVIQSIRCRNVRTTADGKVHLVLAEKLP